MHYWYCTLQWARARARGEVATGSHWECTHGPLCCVCCIRTSEGSAAECQYRLALGMHAWATVLCVLYSEGSAVQRLSGGRTAQCQSGGLGGGSAPEHGGDVSGSVPEWGARGDG